ncbi:hypothetical protein MVES1_000798 [Malassezia vespertilionis]|uniref:Uncharacterized protein n=1 Tax=Malassezia vespertilionis TaxID=2020962 RepID=A0A2N1JEQ3_9BASI|nr:uncharacterized protein MVES1_000798 [Malassezia vespertilionis]PKI85037.1 hypothetical protein MVES_000748 [Malassezia vespertilionis]WFD05468.1 hypothetical protein MVES1_000798 [Malassezia vespertilionis]
MNVALEAAAHGKQLDTIVDSITRDETDPFTFWMALLAYSTEHPEAQDRLIALAKALRTRHVCMLDGEKLWEDLPKLKWALRENFEMYDDTEDEPNEFVNTNKMYAKCVKEGIVDTLMFAVICFRTALEEKNVGDAEVQFKALHAWVEIAGDILYNEGKPHYESSPLCRGGALWKGGPGITKERWEFWGKRIEELGSNSNTSKSLLECMKKISS